MTFRAVETASRVEQDSAKGILRVGSEWTTLTQLGINGSDWDENAGRAEPWGERNEESSVDLDLGAEGREDGGRLVDGR